MEKKKKKRIHPTRIFKSEEDLKIAWDKYKEHLEIERTKWEKIQYVGKDGTRKTDYPKLALTLDGFEVWAYDVYGVIGQYFDNQGGYYDDFIAICSRIRKECRADQIQGGLLGFYNPSITQRLNGLADKQETKDTTEPRVFNISKDE